MIEHAPDTSRVLIVDDEATAVENLAHVCLVVVLISGQIVPLGTPYATIVTKKDI